MLTLVTKLETVLPLINEILDNSSNSLNLLAIFLCPRVYTKVDRGTVRGVPLKREGAQEHSVLRKNTVL